MAGLVASLPSFPPAHALSFAGSRSRASKVGRVPGPAKAAVSSKLESSLDSMGTRCHLPRASGTRVPRLWGTSPSNLRENTAREINGAVAKRLGNGLQNHHTWVRIPSAPPRGPTAAVIVGT